MDEYTALAQRVAVAVGDVHGCLIMSRDGMLLGAHPAGDETPAKPAWLRFAALGEARKGFVEFGDQTWVFVHRGPYSAFAVAGASVRPGLLMDQLEQALLAAEEARTHREQLKLPELPAALTGKPRVPLHPSADKSAVAPAPVGSRAPGELTRTRRIRGKDHEEPTPATTEAHSEPAPGDTSAETPRKDPEDDGTEVDPVLLAKEFSGLLQVDREGDEGSS